MYLSDKKAKCIHMHQMKRPEEDLCEYVRLSIYLHMMQRGRSFDHEVYSCQRKTETGHFAILPFLILLTSPAL